MPMNDDLQRKLRIVAYAITGLAVMVVAVPLISKLLGNVEGTVLFGTLVFGAVAVIASMLRVIA
jgi:hypothetical protein